MPANLNNPFGESCCDGGATTPDHRSAQPCGCDQAAGWLCARHLPKIEYRSNGQERITNILMIDPLERYLNEVITPTWNFANRLETQKDHEQMALTGCAAEAGELLDVGKKLWWHSIKPDGFWREKLLSELGDVLYYWRKAVEVFGFTVQEVLEYNKKKLQSRHPELGKVTERFGKDAIKG